METLVFLSIIVPRTAGMGKRTNIQSTRTFAALCRYVIINTLRLAIEHLPTVIADAVSNGIKPSAAHVNRIEKKESKLTVQEKIIAV
jgi:hypothetical protein